jgi:lipopolysaccharide transport system permease protein
MKDRPDELMNKGLPQVIYTPASQLRHPRQFFQGMWRDLLLSRELAWRLMVRDISAQYRQSFLGFFWAFVPPIATALIFVVLNSRKLINIGETQIPYPAFVLFGTVLWQVFVDSLNAPLKVVTASKPMLAKINFPKEALILSGLGQILFGLSIKLLILIVVFIFYKIPVTPGIPLSLLAILVLVLLGTTFGLLVTPIGVLFTDIAQGLTVVTGLWFFLTPVVYPPPTSFPFSLLAILNPVSPILVGARDLATEGILHNPIPFFAITFLMFLVLIISWIVYRLAIPILVERMSA